MKIRLDVIMDESSACQQQNYRKIRQIGQGGEGQVFNCVEKSTGCEVAVKIIKSNNNISTEKMSYSLRTMGIKLIHTNVIDIHKTVQHGNMTFVVMEMCDEDLLTNLNQMPMGTLSELRSCEIALQLLNGLIGCSDKQIFHGDIKPENILVSKSLVKLADFFHELEECESGVKSKCAINFSTSHCGTKEYLAPELLQSPPQHPAALGAKALAAADVWALGLTLFVMVAGYRPWQQASTDDAEYDRFLKDPQQVWPSWFSSDLRSLLGGMLRRDVDSRMTLKDVWQHPWLLSARGGEPKPALEPLRIQTTPVPSSHHPDWSTNACTPEVSTRLQSHPDGISPSLRTPDATCYTRKRSRSISLN